MVDVYSTRRSSKGDKGRSSTLAGTSFEIADASAHQGDVNRWNTGLPIEKEAPFCALEKLPKKNPLGLRAMIHDAWISTRLATFNGHLHTHAH